MSHYASAKYLSKGFTLTELAIVLVIVALLIGGMLVPLSAQRDIQNTNETQKQLDEIKETLLGFAIINRRLPCPANPATASGTAGAGLEYSPTASGCTTSVEGVLPWATLGVAETDAWGRRLTYRVTGNFAQSPAFFSLTTVGNIDVSATSGGATVASNVPAVIVSHGKNGLGAYLTDGSQMPSSADADEQENYDSDSSWVGNTPTPTFDDQTVWITPAILFNRMISAGRLP